MKILVVDRFERPVLEELRALGVEIVYEPELHEDSLPSKLSGIGILLTRGTKVTAAAIEAGRALNLVVCAAATAAHVDVRAASARGIYVATCPGKNAIAVAELTMGLVCSLDRRIPDAVEQFRRGRWERSELANADGLYGRTMGLAGYGAVAREVAIRARAFGMNIVAYDQLLSPQRAGEHGVAVARSLEELAARAQVFSVHLPLNDRTRGCISGSVLDALPDGAIFVNTAHSDLVDRVALREVIERKRLRVGLDVFPDVPAASAAPFEDAVLAAPGIVYGTPNVGASTAQAQLAVANETVRIVRSFMRTGEVPNVVNVCASTPARFQMVVRSLDKVGVLANVLAVLKRHGLNVEELSATIFDGAIAACTKLRISGRPSDACVNEIRAFDEILHVDVVALPNMA